MIQERPGPHNVFAAMVVQGPHYERLSSITLPAAQKALSMGVVELRVTAPPSAAPYASKAFVEKLRLFEHAPAEARYVMLIDADLLLTGWDWGLLAEPRQFYGVRDTDLFRLVPHCRERLKGPLEDGGIFNTGLFVAHRSIAGAFEEAIRAAIAGPNELMKHCQLGDQGPLNESLRRHAASYCELPAAYNTLILEPHEPFEPASVIGWHVAGGESARRVERMLQLVETYKLNIFSHARTAL